MIHYSEQNVGDMFNLRIHFDSILNPNNQVKK